MLRHEVRLIGVAQHVSNDVTGLGGTRAHAELEECGVRPVRVSESASSQLGKRRNPARKRGFGAMGATGLEASMMMIH